MQIRKRETLNRIIAGANNNGKLLVTITNALKFVIKSRFAEQFKRSVIMNVKVEKRRKLCAKCVKGAISVYVSTC